MNIHFGELFIVIIVALLVIKPERLPEVARTVGRVVKQARETIAKIKHQIESHE